MREFGSLDDGRLILKRHLAAPPSKVWSALTSADQIERWLGVAEIDLKVGGQIAVCFVHADGAEMRGVVTRLEPPRLLEYTWREGGAESLVRWELEPDGEGDTTLTFTQTIDREPDAVGLAAGWHLHLDLLEASLEGGEFAWDDSRYGVVRDEYERRLRGERA